MSTDAMQRVRQFLAEDRVAVAVKLAAYMESDILMQYIVDHLPYGLDVAIVSDSLRTTLDSAFYDFARAYASHLYAGYGAKVFAWRTIITANDQIYVRAVVGSDENDTPESWIANMLDGVISKQVCRDVDIVFYHLDDEGTPIHKTTLYAELDREAAYVEPSVAPMLDVLPSIRHLDEVFHSKSQLPNADRYINGVVAVCADGNTYIAINDEWVHITTEQVG